LNEKLLGTQNITTELPIIPSVFLCTYLKANIGALYLLDETENTCVKWEILPCKNTKEYFKLNEGLIGHGNKKTNC
jgi:hypothetical protein